MADGKISKRVNNCLSVFGHLVSLELATNSSHTANKEVLDSLREEEARFKVWVGNIGAHKTGRSSLDYRLRDASHIQEQVVELITELIGLVENARAIIKGEKIPWDMVEDADSSSIDGDDSEADSAEEDFPKTELEQIVMDTADVINCLLRLSVAIRNPAPHDRFAESVPAIDTDHYEPFDIQHVHGKFGQADQWLADRLGKAISRRRQYFKYRERHHQKLAEGLALDHEIQAANVPRDGVSTIASSIPEEAKAGPVDPSRLAAVDEDALSDSGASQTSFASSIAESETLKIPPMPTAAQRGPFECPFCFRMITASSTISWRRHVFGDLRPYICLWEGCVDLGRTFARRHEWAAHELQNHWKRYVCPLGCKDLFFSPSSCQKHLDTVHPGSIPSNQVDAIISLSVRPARPEDGIQCPLCQEALPSFKLYQHHVGRHQEQLALFALPPLASTGEGDSEVDHSDQSNVGSSSEEHDAVEGEAESRNVGPGQTEISDGNLGLTMSQALYEEIVAQMMIELDEKPESLNDPEVKKVMDDMDIHPATLNYLRPLAPPDIKKWSQLQQWQIATQTLPYPVFNQLRELQEQQLISVLKRPRQPSSNQVEQQRTHPDPEGLAEDAAWLTSIRDLEPSRRMEEYYAQLLRLETEKFQNEEGSPGFRRAQERSDRLQLMEERLLSKVEREELDHKSMEEAEMNGTREPEVWTEGSLFAQAQRAQHARLLLLQQLQRQLIAKRAGEEEKQKAVADGVHSQGVVPGDSKPDNLLLAGDNGLKIDDLGVPEVFEERGNKRSTVPATSQSQDHQEESGHGIGKERLAFLDRHLKMEALGIVPEEASSGKQHENQAELPRTVEESMGLENTEEVESVEANEAGGQNEPNIKTRADTHLSAGPVSFSCEMPGCNRRRCTLEDPNDPKDSEWCREHVCSIFGCIRHRVSTLNAMGEVAFQYFELECDQHFVHPIKRWEAQYAPVPVGVPMGVPLSQTNHFRFYQMPESLEATTNREPAIQTTWRNSHLYAAHYNNPDFQPEEYRPESDESDPRLQTMHDNRSKVGSNPLGLEGDRKGKGKDTSHASPEESVPTVEDTVSGQGNDLDEATRESNALPQDAIPPVWTQSLETLKRSQQELNKQAWAGNRSMDKRAWEMENPELDPDLESREVDWASGVWKAVPMNEVFSDEQPSKGKRKGLLTVELVDLDAEALRQRTTEQRSPGPENEDDADDQATSSATEAVPLDELIVPPEEDIRILTRPLSGGSSGDGNLSRRQDVEHFSVIGPGERPPRQPQPKDANEPSSSDRELELEQRLRKLEGMVEEMSGQIEIETVHGESNTRNTPDEMARQDEASGDGGIGTGRRAPYQPQRKDPHALSKQSSSDRNLEFGKRVRRLEGIVKELSVEIDNEIEMERQTSNAEGSPEEMAKKKEGGGRSASLNDSTVAEFEAKLKSRGAQSKSGSVPSRSEDRLTDGLAQIRSALEERGKEPEPEKDLDRPPTPIDADRFVKCCNCRQAVNTSLAGHCECGHNFYNCCEPIKDN